MPSSIFRQARRFKVLSHYSGGEPKCSCCNEEKLEFLSIDHIDGNGNKHRREIGKGKRIFDWLLQNDFPKGYRILCHNCNLSHGFYGYCPHKDGEKLRPRILAYLNKPPGKGSKHHLAILDEGKVIEIKRRRRDNGEKYEDLALEFGVTKGTISHIMSGRQWKNVA